MMFFGRLAACSVSAALLASCAVNTTRLDRATAMGEAGEHATDRTRSLIGQVGAENRDVVIDLVASDPICAATLPSPVIRNDRSSELCRAGAPMGDDFRIKRWTDLEFAPSLAVIEGISAYLGAVDAVITRKPLDLGKELSDAQAKLQTVSDLFAAVAGTPGLPQLSADQNGAINATLALVSELLTEVDKVDDLRKIELKLDPAEFEATLNRLKEINRELLIDLEVQRMHRQTITAGELKRAAGTRPARTGPGTTFAVVPAESFEVRRLIAEQHLAAVEGRATIPALGQALDRTVEAFRQAHSDYRELLFDKSAKRTKAERRKEAAVTERRVLAALSSLTSLIKAF